MFENKVRPISIANSVQAVLLRAAQLRIVGLEAAFAEVPLDEKDDLCEIFVICETPSYLDWLWKFVAARFRQHIGGLWMGSLNDND